MPYYYDPTYILMIPAIILALYAQARVKSTYKKYAKIGNHRHMTGAQAARSILDRNGLQNVTIQRIGGDLTDHFDPRTNIVSLSQEVFDSESIAAVGIAAHEVGHAIQYNTAYTPIKLRNTILPVAQISSKLAVPLIIVGLVFSGFTMLIRIGVVLYAAVVLFQLLTLPVEFNASHRAVETVYDLGFLDADETKGARRVLSAAALTYVAAAAVALLQLLRLLLLANGRRGRR